MNCREFLTRHSEYADGVIEAAAAERMSAHAQGCGSCARYDRVVRRGAALFRELPGVQLSHDFEARLRHRLYHARDEMTQPRAGSMSIYVAAASLVLAICAAGLASFAVERTPVVDAQVVFADAPPAYTPVEANGLLATAPVSIASDKAADGLSPIGSETFGHDAHPAYPVAWPVYSRGAVAVAFPAVRTDGATRTADFRPVGSRAPVTPLLIRY